MTGLIQEETRKKSSLWRHPNFLRLWTSETISSFGTQFSELAIPLTAVLVLNGTPAELGILNAAAYAPFLIFSLFAGVWVDRHKRKSVLIISSLARALLLATIPVAAATGYLTIFLLLAVVFAVGSLKVFFDIAYQSILPGLVERERLVDANSRLQASDAVSSVAGPASAGAFIQILTAPFAIAFDSISFIFSAILIGRIKHQESSEGPAEHSSVIADIRGGLGLVYRDLRLRAIAGAGATANFFEFAIQAIFFLYAVDVLRLQPDQLGIVLAAGATGAIVGAVLAGPLAKQIGTGPAILSSLILGVAVWAPLIYLATPSTAIPFLVIAWFFGEISFVSWSINQASFRQAICPEKMQGRVNATMRFLTVGAVPVGSLVSGLFGSILGLRLTVGVAELGLLLAPLLLFFSPVRSIKTVTESDLIPAGPDVPFPV